MRAFISGATGVLGRRVVRLLIADGHQIVGLSRSQANTDWLTQHGAQARRGDLFNQDEICDFASDCDAVLHLATSIPTKSKTTPADWATNDCIRRQGTQIMLQAALRNNCDLFLTQSVSLIYGDHNSDWVDENTPIPAQQPEVLQSAVDLERIVQKAASERNLPAIVLRFGRFYCYDSAQTQGMFEMIRQGRFPVIENGAAYWSIINVDDAAKAVLKAMENYENGLGQIFNVSDDEPVSLRDQINYIAEILGVIKPAQVPISVARRRLAPGSIEMLLTSIRCRNQLVKEKLNWAPQYPTYREGYQAEIEKWRQL
ncbi:MAG: NAD(P)-dependent oxidoreductase [Anaerolineales bacterium]|jgi:nucleoside-diphosphate-sugar epimerase